MQKYLSLLLVAMTLSATPEDISDKLAQIIDDSGVPSLAAAAILDGEVVSVGASGLRKVGSPEKVSIDDKYHIGSCTKSMTATLAAMFVESGKLKWDTTVAEIFPRVNIHRDYRNATLEQLLTNTAGTPDDVPSRLWSSLWKNTGSPTDQRMQLVEGILKKRPIYSPGTEYLYSNAGFSIAGAMMEKVSGKPYETLLAEMLFEPLTMNSAGFRAPATNGKVDQPYGHTQEFLMTRAHDPEPSGDNPRGIAPAGAVHCSVLDLLKYAQVHLGSAEPALLSKETLKQLHTPTERQNYAKGWIVTERSWAGGTALTHAGSNTMFYTVIWIAPNKNFAAVAMCNYGEDEGFEKCDEAIGMMIHQFL